MDGPGGGGGRGRPDGRRGARPGAGGELPDRFHDPRPRFPGGLNLLLPRDVAVVGAEDAPEDFHARRDATGKLYRYTILNRRTPSPLDRRYAHRVAVPLAEARMARAASNLLGRHDFAAFRNAGSTPGSAVRELRRLDIERRGDYIRIDVTGDGFLYKMVRNLAGTLIQVGRGKLSPGDVKRILEGRDRRLAGPTAPAKGLCLIEVFY